MEIEHYLFGLGILLIIHLLLAVSYSKEIYYWVPKFSYKILMLLLLWLLPFIGAFVIHYHKLLRPMRNYKQGSIQGGNAVSSGFLEIDTIFNPAVRNRIEAIQQQKTSQQQKAKRNKNILKDLEGESSKDNNNSTS